MQVHFKLSLRTNKRNNTHWRKRHIDQRKESIDHRMRIQVKQRKRRSSQDHQQCRRSSFPSSHSRQRKQNGNTSQSSFEIDKKSDCSLYFSNTNIELKESSFTGVLNSGAHHIDGSAAGWNTDVKGAVNKKFAKINLNDLKFNDNVFTRNNYTMWKAVSVLAVAAIAVIAVTIIVIKKMKSDELSDENREQHDTHNSTLI